MSCEGHRQRAAAGPDVGDIKIRSLVAEAQRFFKQELSLGTGDEHGRTDLQVDIVESLGAGDT